MSTVTIADRLPADELVFDAPKFRELEAARTANGLGPKDHEAMRPLSEQSGAFHPYLGRWVDGDKSGLNGYKNYAGSLLSVGERLAELCAGTDSDRINRSTYYASLPWMKRYLNGRKTLAGKNAGQPLTATNRSKIAGHFTTMAKRDQVEFLVGQRTDPDNAMLQQWRAMMAWQRDLDGAKFAADNKQRYAAMPSDKFFEEDANVKAALTWPAKRLRTTVEALVADPAMLTKLTSTELQVFVGMLAPLHMHTAEIGDGDTVDIRWACRDAEVWATSLKYGSGNQVYRDGQLVIYARKPGNETRSIDNPHIVLTVTGRLKAGFDELARRATEAGSVLLFKTEDDSTRRIPNSTFSNWLHAARGRLAKAEGVEAMGTHALRRYANMQVLRDHGTRSAVISAMLKVHAHGAAVAIGAPDRVAPYNRPEAPTKTEATPAGDEPALDPIAGKGPDSPLAPADAPQAAADNVPESAAQPPLSPDHPPPAGPDKDGPARKRRRVGTWHMGHRATPACTCCGG